MGMDVKAKELKVAKDLSRNMSIGFGSFLALTASMVLTVYEYATFATGGWSLILYLMVAGLCFFLPVAMAAAELGTVRKWEKHGVYIWVKETLGPRWGFYAISSQWMEISIGFCAMFYFLVSSLGFVFGGTPGFNILTENTSEVWNSLVAAPTQTAVPALYLPLIPLHVGQIGYHVMINGQSHFIEYNAMQVFGNGVTAAGGNSKSLMQMQSSFNPSLVATAGAIFGTGVLLLAFLSVISLFGAEWIAKFTKFGFWAGIAGPTFIVVILGIIYLAQGNPVHTFGSFAGANPMQHTNEFTRGLSAMGSFAVFMSIIVAFAGPESSASLANRLRKVNKNYPLAIFVLMFMSVSFSICAGIFIALTTNGPVNFSGGISLYIMNMFLVIDPHMSVPMAESADRIIMAIVCFGIIAEIVAWIVGPATGIRYAALDGLYPKAFTKKNRWEIPWFVVMVQGFVVLVWWAILTLALGATSSGSFVAGLQTTVLIYMITYILMFVAHIKLWFCGSKTPRAFRIKYKWLALTIGFVGLICVSFAWTASWMDTAGVPTDVWYASLACIFIAVVAYEEINYEVMKIIAQKKIAIEKGLDLSKYHSYFEKRRAILALMKQLKEAKDPAWVECKFTAPEFKQATPEELAEEKIIEAEEKERDEEWKKEHHHHLVGASK